MEDGKALILDQLYVINHFPSFISTEDSKCMVAKVSLQEIETALKSFKKDRSSRPDRVKTPNFLKNLKFLKCI